MGNALLTVPIDVTPLIIFRLCPDQTRLSLRHHLCTGKQRVRAFVKTLLLYALVGPLVGLLSLVPIAVLVVAWDTIADWLAFMSRAQSPPCDPPHDGIFDLRCYQQVAPFHFNLHIDAPSLQTLSLYVFTAYVIGFVPAVFAGLLIAQAMLLTGNAFRFWHALALGCLVGVIFSASVTANHYLHDAHFFQGFALLVYVCAIATGFCWLPASRWWPPS
jgi:hypothetical protein